MLSFKKSVNLFLFLYFLCLNFFQPMMTDDFDYSNSAALASGKMMNFIYNIYFTWTGRISATFLEWTVFNKPYNFISIPIFNIVNSILMVIFYNSLYNILYYKNKSYKNPAFFILSLTTVLIISGFLKNALWKTGGVQYFWPICTIFVLFECYLYKDKLKKNTKLFYCFLVCFLGFFISTSNEIFFATIFIVFSISLLFEYIFKYTLIQNFKTKTILWFSTGLCAGGLVAIFAPGNYVRMNSMDKSVHYTLWDKFILFFENFKTAYRVDMLISIFLLSLFLRIVFIRDKKLYKTYILQILIVFSSYSVFLPISNYGFNADRIFMLQDIILFCFIYSNFLVLLEKINLKIIVLEKSFLLKGGIVCFLVLILSVNLKAYYKTFEFNQQRYLEIVKFKTEKNDSPTFTAWHPNKLDKMLINFADIYPDSNDVVNRVYSQYYGFKSVKTE